MCNCAVNWCDKLCFFAFCEITMNSRWTLVLRKLAYSSRSLACRTRWSCDHHATAHGFPSASPSPVVPTTTTINSILIDFCKVMIIRFLFFWNSFSGKPRKKQTTQQIRHNNKHTHTQICGPDNRIRCDRTADCQRITIVCSPHGTTTNSEE